MFLRPRRAPRRGLTLMELVVVMAILIALAAIIIPLLPGLIGRAETSSRATNHQEIYKAIQEYEGAYTRYPEDWDALTDASGATLGWLDGTSGGANIGFGGANAPLAITALTGPQTNALRSAGITRLQALSTTAPTGNNITFNPYADLTDRSKSGITLAANGTPSLATLTTTGQFQLNLSDNATTSTGTYVVFGFGNRASIVGIGAHEAPVNFFDSAGLSPDTRYSRYGVVFQVSGRSPTQAASSTTNVISDYSRAKFVRVIRFGGTLGTGDAAIQSYWSDVTTGGGS